MYVQPIANNFMLYYIYWGHSDSDGHGLPFFESLNEWCCDIVASLQGWCFNRVFGGKVEIVSSFYSF